MTEPEPLGKSISQNVRRCRLTEDEMFCLWRAAIKDDAGLVDAIIDKTYADMMAFDSQRAESVMELTVKRKSAAKHLFKGLLQDILDFSVPKPAAASGLLSPRRVG